MALSNSCLALLTPCAVSSHTEAELDCVVSWQQRLYENSLNRPWKSLWLLPCSLGPLFLGKLTAMLWRHSRSPVKRTTWGVMKASYQQPAPTCQPCNQATFEVILYPKSGFQMITAPANTWVKLIKRKKKSWPKKPNHAHWNYQKISVHCCFKPLSF